MKIGGVMYSETPSLLFVTIRENAHESCKLLYSGPWESWKPHPDGVVVKVGDKFLINGEIEIPEVQWNNLHLIPSKLQIIINNTFDSKKGYYHGGFDSWSTNTSSVIIRRGNSFYLVPIGL